MADNIVFNPGDSNYSGGSYRPNAIGGITKLFMKIFGSSTQEAANKVMLVVAVLFFIASAVVLVLFR